MKRSPPSFKMRSVQKHNQPKRTKSSEPFKTKKRQCTVSFHELISYVTHRIREAESNLKAVKRKLANKNVQVITLSVFNEIIHPTTKEAFAQKYGDVPLLNHALQSPEIARSRFGLTKSSCSDERHIRRKQIHVGNERPKQA